MSGLPLGDLQVEKAKPVLFIQVDMTDADLHSRWTGIGLKGWGEDLMVAVTDYQLNILNPTATTKSAERLRDILRLHKDRQFKLIFIDSLRKIHPLSENDAESVAQVYGALKEHFPGATVVIIHHDSKMKDPDTDAYREDQSFRGSSAWVTDAAMGLKVRVKNRRERIIELRQTKHHGGEQQPPLEIQFDDSGVASLSAGSSHKDVAEILRDMLRQGVDKPTKLDLEIAFRLGCSKRTAQRRRLEIYSTYPHLLDDSTPVI